MAYYKPQKPISWPVGSKMHVQLHLYLTYITCCKMRFYAYLLSQKDFLMLLALLMVGKSFAVCRSFGKHSVTAPILPILQ